MTNEEAIEVLKNDIEICTIQQKQACDLAIKALEQQPSLKDRLEKEYLVESLKEDLQKLYAENEELHKKLEQQPCEDCISRKETIEWLKKVTVTDGITFKTGFEQIIYDIEQMPSVTPKAEWIPCSERLPENYIHVLCQFTLGGMGECYLAHGVFHLVGGVIMTCNEVVAWQPLPQRYEVESEEEE